jgi:hypothetical protein
MSDQALNDRLDDLEGLLKGLADRLIIEDGWGNRYRLARTLVIGRVTDDPGISIKIEQESRHPDV